MKEKIIDTFKSIKAFVIENKKHFIIIGVLFVAFIITCIARSIIVKDIFRTERDVTIQQYNDVENAIRQAQQTINNQTAIDSDYEKLRQSNANLIGNKVDVGRWSDNDNTFWAFIEDALNCDSGTDFNEKRMKYVQALGHCVFTDVILKPYSPETAGILESNYYIPTGDNGEQIFDQNGYDTDVANADKNYKIDTPRSTFTSYPTAISDDSYTYLAKVTVRSVTVSGAQYDLYFKYTIDKDNNLTGFECYSQQ